MITVVGGHKNAFQAARQDAQSTYLTWPCIWCSPAPKTQPRGPDIFLHDLPWFPQLSPKQRRILTEVADRVLGG